jgi:ankyrin repeat protein
MGMRNIKGYTEHLRESAETPEELGQRLIGILTVRETPDIKEIKRLILAGANLEAKDQNGWIALSLAVFRGHTEAVKVLIEAGADLKARSKAGDWTPLHFAAAYDITEAAKLLIEAGADLEAKTPGNQTPLHFAAAYDSTEAAKILIEAGADLEARDKDDQTPLHYAALNGRTGIAKLLILAGSDISAAFDSFDNLEDLFGGDTSWVPLNTMPPKFRRPGKKKRLFGI